MRWLYTLLLTLAAPLLLRGLYKRKPGKPPFGERWKEHFGVTPKLNNPDTSPLWIHAVSVGECIAVIPLIRAIKQAHPDLPVVVTTTTSTGAEQIAKLGELAEHRYMPLDFPFAVKAFIKAIRPSQLIIAETELWPNTLSIVSDAGIPVTVINARLSERSKARYQKVPGGLVTGMLSKINLIICQHQEDANRFEELGVNKDKLAVSGSVKFDIAIPESVRNDGANLRNELGSGRPVWIAASTHRGEDEKLLNEHSKVLKQYPDALLILVPRHPERFNEVFGLCQSSGFSTARRTQSSCNPVESQVYLADTMGEMLCLLAAADVCFMGGSLLGDAVGGHNVLEPAALGVPTITGPSYFNFLDITNALVAEQAVIVAGEEVISSTLIKLFKDPDLRNCMSDNAQNYVAKQRGAVAKTLALADL